MHTDINIFIHFIHSHIPKKFKEPLFSLDDLKGNMEYSGKLLTTPKVLLMTFKNDNDKVFP